MKNTHYAISKLEDKWIRLELYEKDSNITLQVIDSGNGIEENLLDNIFQPFFTSKKSW